MILRQFLYPPTACASYLFGCTTHGRLAVVEPHAALVDRYLEAAAEAGSPIVAVFDTHVQADHVSGLPELVHRTGAKAYLPAGADVEFDHVGLREGQRVELGNTIVTTLLVPGHAPAHAAYLVADRRRGTEDPWLVFTGDSLLVAAVGRPDLHAGHDGLTAEELAHAQFDSMQRLLGLPDDVLVYPGHYSGSVCGHELSGNPVSTIGFERRHNAALGHDDADSFAAVLLENVPPPPADQAAIVEANRSGRLPAPA